jgi:serine/threonine protein kinase
MPCLRALEGANDRQDYILYGDATTIGRNPDCQVVIGDPAVSRKHALILCIHGRYFIEDLQSRNGTFVNNRRITARTPIEDKDRIKIGPKHLAFLKTEPSPLLPPDPPLSEPQPEHRIVSAWKHGDRIENRWEVQQVLDGGMGIIYIVLDHETGEKLAAKTYRDDVLAANPELALRFEREALAWINLDSHPNVVKAMYVKTFQDRPYLFLEFVAGGNLRRLLPSFHVSTTQEDGYYDYERLSRIRNLALQFCDGMIHASKCGIRAHRDIKAKNCLLAEDARGWPILKITDFGLAKLFNDAAVACDDPYIVSTPHHESIPAGLKSCDTVSQPTVPEGLRRFVTVTGVAAGTPSHMAPEQFNDVKRVDVRADIYSFGVMLFQMITGRLPFTGRSWLDYRRLHQTVLPPTLHTYSLLNDIVGRCLAKSPSERFGDFLELRKALEPSVFDPFVTYVDWNSPLPPRVANELTVGELLQKASSLVVLRRHQDALQLLTQVVERHPGVGKAWLERGLLLMNVFSRFDEALASLEQARGLGEHVLEGHIALCRSKLV